MYHRICRRKRFYTCQLFVSLVTIVCSTLAMPATALAWKPTTHVYLAMQALDDALDDGMVTIYRVDYATGTVLDEMIGEYAVDSTILAALQSNPAHYRAGIFGPDAYPDIPTGQQVIHPSPDGESGTGIEGGSNAWLTHLWEQSLLPGNDTPAIKAFTVGYLTHAAGDMFAHTFINQFTGGEFAITPPAGPENAIKHVIVEGYVDKRLDATALDDAFFTASIDGVEPFIYHTLIDARPGTVLDTQLLLSASKSTDYSIPRLFSTLRAGLEVDIARQRQIAANCAWFQMNCSKVISNAIADYEEAWVDDIDRGLQAWPTVSHEVATALFFNPERRTDIVKAEEVLKRYLAEHLVAMAGAPKDAGAVLGVVFNVLSFLSEPIRQIKEDILNTMLRAAIGMDKQQLQDYLTRPDRYFDEVMTSGAGQNITLEAFNTEVLHLTDTGYTDPEEAFDYQRVPAAYNTVTMSKLVLLAPEEVNRLLSDLGSQASLTKPNIMLGFIETLDGDNQWANGMVLAQECQVYQQIFMLQPGERACTTN